MSREIVPYNFSGESPQQMNHFQLIYFLQDVDKCFDLMQYENGSSIY